MNKKLLVPDIGDFEKVEVIEILIKKGDKVSVNDPVITIESDKSSVEIPSTLEGKIESINVKIGDKVSKDDLVLTVNVENENSDQKKESQAKENIPKDTESIINQAEKTLIAEKENISVVGVDIGGATTDVFSVFSGKFNRTVSANLDMRYSICNVWV